MPTTTYTTIDGQIVSENRAGVQKFYGPDPLGSVVTIYDTTGTVTDTFVYWPYGEIRTSTGSTATPFKFCGTWGYYSDATGRLYVRARVYRDKIARWQTVDPLWPKLWAYKYCRNIPLYAVDPSGMIAIADDLVVMGAILLIIGLIGTEYMIITHPLPPIQIPIDWPSWGSSPAVQFPPTAAPINGGTQYPFPIGPGITKCPPVPTLPPWIIPIVPILPMPTPIFGQLPCSAGDIVSCVLTCLAQHEGYRGCSVDFYTGKRLCICGGMPGTTPEEVPPLGIF
ncbi:MAG: RHS repeat-associated core domain-containing protein [Fimbriimonadaceae bacterium]